MSETNTTVVVRGAEQWAEAAHALTRTIPGCHIAAPIQKEAS